MNTSITLQCSLGEKTLSTCIWNASGPSCTTAEELKNLDSSRTAVTLSKSCTSHPREGNPSPRYKDIPHGSINSMGLPNLGVDFYLDFADKRNHPKPYIISVAGLTPEENIHIIQKIQASQKNVTAIELNLSCPNLIGKPQLGYDAKATQQLLQDVFKTVSTIPIGLKLPPYFDMAHYEEMATVLGNYPIAFITAINSIGNALYIDPSTDGVVIKPKHGFGGLGGLYIKPTALANVRKWYELLPHIPIIGCGGISCGQDIYEHLLCGATAVQVGTAFMQEGISIFERLENELIAIMQKKAYTQLDDFRGKLKLL